MKDKTSEGLFTLIDQFFRIINRFEKERTLFKTVIVSRINAEGCYYGNIDGQEYELPNGTAMTFLRVPASLYAYRTAIISSAL